MEFPTTVHPIHLIYQAVCDSHKENLISLFGNQNVPETELTPENEHGIVMELRQVVDERARTFPVPKTTTRTKQQVFGGHNNVTVDTTVFRPLGTENDVLPVLLHCHGGGWVSGSIISYAKIATDLCVKVLAAVMLVEYSLSPEVKFPIANEQTFAALCWLKEHGKSINIDPDQIAVAGDSAGGNMAAVISLMDRGMGNVIKSQILMYPAVGADIDLYKSYKTYGGGECFRSVKEARLCSKLHLPKPALELNDPYATPLLATIDQLRGLPLALVISCECDILRDETEACASQLSAAGVYTIGIRVLGSIHAFMTLPTPDTPQYHTSIKIVCDFIKQHFNTDLA